MKAIRCLSPYSKDLVIPATYNKALLSWMVLCCVYKRWMRVDFDCIVDEMFDVPTSAIGQIDAKKTRTCLYEVKDHYKQVSNCCLYILNL